MKAKVRRRLKNCKRRIQRRLRKKQWPEQSRRMFRDSNLQYEMGNKTQGLPCGGLGAVHLLVQQLDLSYAILPWSPQLHNGAALKEKYGDRVGFRYYEDEDRGIFWSNDPQVPIGEMIRSLNLGETDQELRRIRKLYRKAGVPE